MLARMAMMAITTSSSMSVKEFFFIIAVSWELWVNDW
jgi:hypothetical protein